MIQILGLRVLKNSDSKYDAFFDRNWRAPSVLELFKDLNKTLALIPKEEQWNLFYTLANCTEDKRVFKSQGVLAFDIDGIDFERREEYIPIILEVLGLYRHDTGIVVSGNGLHFIVGLSKTITKGEFFKEYKQQYKIVCNKINFALAERDLPGACDPVIFEPRRILRLPGTINRKPNKPERRAELLQAVINKVDFDLEKISGMPLVKSGDQLPDQIVRKYRFDAKGVLEGCEFLKWCKDKPNEVSEPQWYAALSITGVLDNGKEISHELSRGHRDYTAHATDEKLAAALSGSRPRTCENINTLWRGCAGCAYYNDVRSPVSIRGDGFIKTELSGFHSIVAGVGGKIKLVPNYDDLREYFQQRHQYRILSKSKMAYIYNEQFYEFVDKNEIEAFAQEHFNPSCDNRMASEFLGRVMRNRIEKMEWWNDSIKGLLNFENGILNLKTNEFLPHSPEYGFRFILPFAYDSRAEAPNFKKMLNTIFHSNQDVIDVVLEYMGYAMAGDRCWAQKALVLEGDGSNGKSTLMNIFKKMVGKGNYTSLSLKDIQHSESNRQFLDGKLLNISEETPSQALVDSSMFKNLVTGGEMQMKALYKDPYTNEVIAKQIFSCNKLPKTTDTTHGFFRRLLLVEFNHVFDKSSSDFDPFIEEKMDSELPGIFNLALDAYKRLKKNRGFTKSEIIDKAVSKYKEQTDTVRMWLKTNVAFFPLESGLGKQVKFCEFFDSYVLAVRAWGETPENKVNFSKQFKKLLLDYDARHKEAKIERKVCKVLCATDYGEDAGLMEENINSEVIMFDK